MAQSKPNPWNKQTKQKAHVLFLFRYPIHFVELIRQYIQISYWLSWMMLTSLTSLTTQKILPIPIKPQYFLLLNSLKKMPSTNFPHLVVELVLDFTLSFSYQDQKTVILSCFRWEKIKIILKLVWNFVITLKLCYRIMVT